MTEYEQVPLGSWGLDCFFWTHVKVFLRHLKDFKRMNESHAEVLSMYGHPMSLVEIIGTVTFIDFRAKSLQWIRNQYSHFRLMAAVVDDGTDTVCCINWHPTGQTDIDDITFPKPVLGEVILVHGRLTTFHGDLQVCVTEPCNTRYLGLCLYCIVQRISCQLEQLWMLECAHLHRFVYPKKIH